MFAKIFESELGQILVKADANGDGDPEVRFYFKPEDMGVCSYAICFNGDDEGWDLRDNAFNEIDQAKAQEVVKNIIHKMPVGLTN